MPCSMGTPSATSTATERTRSVPNTRYWAVRSGMRICSSTFCQLPPLDPLRLSIPMISKGIPRIRMVWSSERGGVGLQLVRARRTPSTA